MTDSIRSPDAVVGEESVTLSSGECRHLRRSSRIHSRPKLRKKLRWLEYAKSGEDAPLVRVSDRNEFVVLDVEPVYAHRTTLEIPRTTEFSIDEERSEVVLHRVWYRVRNPERVRNVYLAEVPRQGSTRTYVVVTVDLETGSRSESVVRTTGDSVTTTTADFRLYPRLEPEVFDD